MHNHKLFKKVCDYLCFNLQALKSITIKRILKHLEHLLIMALSSSGLKVKDVMKTKQKKIKT
jgi:hypothetical protein